MFEDPLQDSPAPQRGPMPGAPMPPLVSGDVMMPPNSAQPVSPERTPGLPPIPMNLPPMTGGGGANWKKILIFGLAIVALIGGGVVAAMLLFPSTNQNDTNGETNTNLANANTNLNANANANRNLNVNSNTNANRNTNASLNGNTNVSGNTNVVINANLNSNSNSNTNGSSNLNIGNANSNANKNLNVNVNSNKNVNASNTNTGTTDMTLDTDKDSLVDYLEDWMHTNKSKADSDGDTYTDGTEVKSGYSPLGKGKLSIPGLKQYCATSVLVTQYAFSSTDTTNFCVIAGDLLASIQVMVANPTLTQNLDTQLASSCTTFGKIDQVACVSVIQSVFVDYETSDSAT